MDTTIREGLDGVVAAKTRLSSVDGLAGELIIAGFPVEELADQATFEETVHLLWHGKLPNQVELTHFRQALAGRRSLSKESFTLLQAAASQKLPVMDALRMAAGTLNLGSTNGNSNGKSNGNGNIHRESYYDAMRLVASFPTVVATYWRLLNNEIPVLPNPELGHAANYLYMLFDRIPTDAQTRGMETYLNTVVDHGFNASTFTARTIISTQSDMISAVVGAIGALKGPLHGGAPGPALDMVFEIGQEEKAEPYLRQKIERGERLMGFGHRVYKVLDPRAVVLSKAAKELYTADGGDMNLYKLAHTVENIAVRLLEEYKPGRNLQTNVEFYTALLLHGLGLSTDLFSPTFAVSRVGGWTAHCFEHQEAGRLIRPQSLYSGAKDQLWTSVEAR